MAHFLIAIEGLHSGCSYCNILAAMLLHLLPCFLFFPICTDVYSRGRVNFVVVVVVDDGGHSGMVFLADLAS